MEEGTNVAIFYYLLKYTLFKMLFAQKIEPQETSNSWVGLNFYTVRLKCSILRKYEANIHINNFSLEHVVAMSEI